jgi:hypothetical protein
MKCEKSGKLEEVLTIKQRRLNTEYFMFILCLQVV